MMTEGLGGGTEEEGEGEGGVGGELFARRGHSRCNLSPSTVKIVSLSFEASVVEAMIRCGGVTRVSLPLI